MRCWRSGAGGNPKARGLVREYGEQARVCRDVSVVKRDLALTLDWDAARYTPPANDALYTLYRDLEFKDTAGASGAARRPAAAAVRQLLQGNYQSYTAVTEPADHARIAVLLDAAATRGRVRWRCAIDALAVSFDDGEAFAFLISALDVPAVGVAFAQRGSGSSTWSCTTERH